MIENIQDLWGQIENRKDVICVIADSCNVKPISVSKNWLCDSGFWSIPVRHQETVVTILQRSIYLQNN